MKHKTAAIIDRGNVREKNEDSYLLCTKRFGRWEAVLAAVADGMGGLSCGEHASRYTTECIRQWWEQTMEGREQPPALQEMQELLGFVVERIHKQLQDEMQERQLAMGTTLSMLCLWKMEYILWQVGDSRIYLIHGSSARQMTKDQTWCQEEMDAGRLTEEQAAMHPKRHVLTNALGSREGLFIDVQTGKAKKGRRFLLCSDGYYHYFCEKELKKRLFCRNPQKLLERSAERIKMGAAEDNFTAVMVEV